MYANKTRVIFKKDTLRFATPYIYTLTICLPVFTSQVRPEQTAGQKKAPEKQTETQTGDQTGSTAPDAPPGIYQAGRTPEGDTS